MIESILKKIECPLGGGRLSLTIYKRKFNHIRNEYNIIDGFLSSKKKNRFI